MYIGNRSRLAKLLKVIVDTGRFQCVSAKMAQSGAVSNAPVLDMSAMMAD